jgi:hypothetical protein
LPNIERLGILQMSTTRVRHAALGHLVASIHGVKNVKRWIALAAVVLLGCDFVQPQENSAHWFGLSKGSHLNAVWSW